MTTCPEIYTVRVHPVSKMVRVMPTETEVTEAKTASPIIAPQQEKIVLTACMRSKDVREDILPMLIEDDFVKSDHRTLFRAIRAMHEADYPIDEVSLLDYLKSSRKLDAAGGEKSGARQVILSVAKNRSGPTGDIDMLFVPTSTKFYEVGPRKENHDD